MHDKLDWLIISGISLTIITLVLFIFSLIHYFIMGKEIKKLDKNKKKYKRKMDRWKTKRKRLIKTRKAYLTSSLLLILVMILIGGSTGYARFYQMTNLSKQDTETFALSYYLIDKLEEHVEKSSEENNEKMDNNIQELAQELASFSSKKASNKFGQEGQVLLNKYFTQIGQLGINIGSQNYSEQLELEGTLDDTLSDVSKIKVLQKQLIDKFEIKTATLN